MSNEQTFLMKPKVDFCFKELMEDAEVRKGFISALLGVKPEEIEHTVLLPTHLRQEHPEDKLGIQLAPFPLWPERSVFYLAKMYTGEIQKGRLRLLQVVATASVRAVASHWPLPGLL